VLSARWLERPRLCTAVTPATPDPSGLDPQTALAFFASADPVTQQAIRDQLDHDRRVQWNGIWYDWAAMGAGLVIAVLFLGAGLLLVLESHPVPGVITSCADLAALVAAVKTRPK
jgi:hypothetical protein